MEPVHDPGRVLEKARRLGPLPYREAGSPGRVAVGSGPDLVGWMSDALDLWWDRSGHRDPYTVVELGAGDGNRARGVLGQGPHCLEALRYVLVESQPELRALHPEQLPIERPAFLLGPVLPEDGDDESPARPLQGIGPMVTSLPELPVLGDFGVVIAIGWLSSLPSDRIEWRDGQWYEVRLAADDRDQLVEMLVPLDPARQAQAVELVKQPNPGDRFALLGPAAEWLSGALRVAEAGILAVVDRWTGLTEPVSSDEVPPLVLNQLSSSRQPNEARPVELFSGLSVATWDLG